MQTCPMGMTGHKCMTYFCVSQNKEIVIASGRLLQVEGLYWQGEMAWHVVATLLVAFILKHKTLVN